MFLVVLLASIALFFTTLANIRNRQQDREDAVRALVAQCEATNQSRKNTYDSNMALALLAVYNARTPIEELPPLIRDFVKFTQQAFEPLNCDPESPDFARDVTPPDSIPSNPLIERLANEDFG